MPKAFEDLRILLLQARTSQDILSQEQDCFIERCLIGGHQLYPVNAPDRFKEVIRLSDFDAMMIGGAGEYSATQDYEWTPFVVDLIKQAYERSLPTFGSCWGHQMIARALGGEVRYDREKTEMGCHWIELNESGMSDELFGAFPRRFKANMGHHDRVTKLPPDAIELAVSDTQPYQAFRLAGKPMYGTQFHSELDAQREKDRLYAYRDHYDEVETEAEFQSIIDGLAETTEVDGLLHQFLMKFVLGEQPVTGH